LEKEKRFLEVGEVSEGRREDTTASSANGVSMPNRWLLVAQRKTRLLVEPGILIEFGEGEGKANAPVGEVQKGGGAGWRKRKENPRERLGFLKCNHNAFSERKIRRGEISGGEKKIGGKGSFPSFVSNGGKEGEVSSHCQGKGGHGCHPGGGGKVEE